MKKCLTLFRLLIGSLAAIISLWACNKETAAPPPPSNLLFTIEEEQVLSKHLDLAKFEQLPNKTRLESYQLFLGRVLFYDKNLSVDRSVACASCHQHELAFSDNKAFSRGANGNLTKRNAISLGASPNFADHYDILTGKDLVDNYFFWDNRAQTIEEQLTQTLTNESEMGLTYPQIGERISEIDYAKILYQKIYGTETITSEKVIDAIAIFVTSLYSDHSKFDNAKIGLGSKIETPFEAFSEAENQGKAIFLEHCASCHAFSLSPTLRHKYDNLATIASNGLDLNYKDLGLATHTELKEEEGVFRIPGLRNVSLSAPYMHDGRFQTLEEVVDFYSEGINRHPNLDNKLKEEGGNPKKMNFTIEEKAAIIQFLHTLTGRSHLDNASFYNPFND